MNQSKRDRMVESTANSATAEDVQDDAAIPSSGWQTAGTLFVLLHFFCAFAALSANYSPSPLQRRLTRVLAPYTQTLNLDLNFTPYHLTHASDQDVDHALQYQLPAPMNTAENLTAGENDEQPWLDVARGWRGGERRKRYQRLAGVLSFFREDAATSSRIGQAVAGGLANHDGFPLRRIRCRKHFLLPWDRYGDLSDGDPASSQYFQTVYAANVLIGADGQVDVVKIEAPKEVARPRLRETD